MTTPSTGSASTPVLFIVAFVSVSVLVFFTVTLPTCGGEKGDPVADSGKGGRSGSSASGGEGKIVDPGDSGGTRKAPGTGTGTGFPDSGAPGGKTTPPDLPVTPDPGESGLSSRYPAGSPGATVGSVVDFLKKGDFESLRSTLGEAIMTAEKAGQIEEIFAELGVKISEEEPMVQFANVLRNPRWAINLDRKTPEGFPNRILLDFEKSEPAAPGSTWAVSDMLIPAASAFGTGEPGGEASAAALAEDGFPASLRGADAITVADAFVHSVATQQFKLAKRLSTDPNLNFEQIAALCIVFEDGQFELLKDEAPLRQTQERNSKAWVLSYLKGKELGDTTQFGLEMARNAEGEWTVDAVLLDTILETYAAAGGGATTDTFYAPIVKNPRGGDSLPVFFKYGSAELVPRGTRQVDVIGNILLANPERKLTISGYADSQGSEDYNFRLSATRAYAVRARLVELGVDTERIDVKAFGETKPLSPEVRKDGTDSKVGRAENRRTEILLDF